MDPARTMMPWASTDSASSSAVQPAGRGAEHLYEPEVAASSGAEQPTVTAACASTPNPQLPEQLPTTTVPKPTTQGIAAYWVGQPTIPLQPPPLRAQEDVIDVPWLRSIMAKHPTVATPPNGPWKQAPTPWIQAPPNAAQDVVTVKAMPNYPVLGETVVPVKPKPPSPSMESEAVSAAEQQIVRQVLERH